MLICPFFKSMSCHCKMEPLKIVGNRTPGSSQLVIMTQHSAICISNYSGPPNKCQYISV